MSNRSERLEVEPNDAAEAAQPVPLDAVVNGRIDKPGDVDCYRFTARAGQRAVSHCGHSTASRPSRVSASE